MKRISKIIFCALAIALIICSFTLPCFAIDWSDELGQTETIILPSASQALIDGWGSEEARRSLESIVNNAYEKNAFNGRRPIAIIFYSPNVNSCYIQVVTCSESYPLANFANAGARLEYNDENPDIMVLSMSPIDNASNSQLGMMTYLLMENGSFRPASTSGATSIAIGNGQGRLLYSYYNGNTWVENPLSEFYITSYGLPGSQIPIDGILTEPSQTQPSALTRISINWQPDSLIIERPQYTLDIPGIITAIPNGAKQMINNAFGFEIFGINVAGLLSVVLIVTIVAFVVKWLMSR